MIRRLDDSWQVNSLSLNELDVNTARTQLLGEIDSGKALTSFFGHSGPTTWTFDGLLNAQDVGLLNNAGRPTVVTQWGCWNTYFVSPLADTMAHQFLLSGDRGAAAVIGASTLTQLASDQAIGLELIPTMALPGTRIGDAMIMAKSRLDPRQHRDVLYGFTLLGDPALIVVDD